MKQTCILVLGMHRSGTSALTGVLQYLNIDLGSKLSGSAEDNKKGFFENLYFVQFNEKILKKLGGSWDDIFFNFELKKCLLEEDDKNELKSILLKEFSQSQLFAIKDPRICYLFPLYKEVLESLNIDIKILLPYRNPLEVAKSLEKRNGFQYEKSIMLWLNYFLNAEKYSRDFERYFLKFDDLINNTDSVIENMNIKLKLNIYSIYINYKNEINFFLESDLKHQNIDNFEFPSVLKNLIPDLNIICFEDLNLLSYSVFNKIEENYFKFIEFFINSYVIDKDIAIKVLDEKIKIKDEMINKLDEKIKIRDKKIIKLQENVRKQTAWAKDLIEKNRIKDENILSLKKDFENMKYSNNLMFSRLKKLESSKLIMFLEKLNNIKNQNANVILKKILNRIIPKFVPKVIKKRKNNKLINEMKSIQNDTVVVVFPIIAWGFRWQRPQHMLSGLAKKGYTILYVSKDFELKDTTNDRKNILEHIKFTKLDKNIFKVHLSSIKPLNIYKDELDINSLHWFVLQLIYILKNFKDKNIIYLIQFPNWLNLVKKLVVEIKGNIVFDCMDEHSGFSNVDKQIIKYEKELIKIADLVISSSNKLYDKNILENKNTVKIKNGTEFEFFATKQESDELNKYLNKPIIGYYGAISDWFDIEMLEYCAKNRPEYNFILIGSTFGCDIANIQKLNNVFFLGEKPYSELPKYLYKFDVCTIPFKIIPLIEATNPVKFYEYISAGKPVVSTKLPELEDFKDICYLANDREEFLDMLDRAVKEKELSNYDELVKIRVKIAKENSWDSRVEMLNEELKKIQLWRC